MPTYETVQLQKIKEIAIKNDWIFIEEPDTKYCAKLITPKNVYFLIGAELGINSSGSNRVCNDKAYTQYFLQLEHLNIIPTRIVFNNIPAIDQTEYPLICKPNIGWGGKGISIVNNKNELEESISIAKKNSDVVLLQKFIEMPEYRILVFDESVYFTYQRTLPQITGNGISTLKELIEMLVLETKAKIDLSDERLRLRLRQLKMNFETILPANYGIELFLNANLSSGGKWIDKSNETSSFYKTLAIKATRAMGLVVAGIDMFCKNISGDSDDYFIIEVNASPGLQYLQDSPEMTAKFFTDLENYLKNRG